MSESAASKYSRPFWQWYAAVVLMLLYSCATLDRHVASVVIQPIKAEFALTDGQVGMITGFLFGIANAVAGMFLGPLIDRVNRRNLLCVFMTLWSIFTWGAGASVNFATLLTARAAVGAAEAVGVPASLSILSNIFPPGKRGTFSGFFFLSSPLGTFLAAAGGGWIAGEWGWRAAFFAAGAPGLLLALLMLFTLPEPNRDTSPAEAPKVTGSGLLSALGFILRHPVLSPFYMGLYLLALVTGGYSVFRFAFFMRAHGVSITEVGAILGTIAALGGVVGALLGGAISDWLAKAGANRPVYWLALVAVLSGVADIVMVTHPSLTWALVAASAAAVVGPMWLGPGYGVAMTQSPDEMRGRALALIQIGMNLCVALGALVIGVLSDAYGGQEHLGAAMATVASVYFVIAALFLLAAIRQRGVQSTPVLASTMARGQGH